MADEKSIMLKTDRLLLRRFSNSDFPKVVKHRSDIRIMKYLGGIQSPEKVAERLKTYNDFFDINGYAMCAMIWRETGEFIGVGGLQKLLEDGETEVGYTVAHKFWNMGIATECTLACLRFGFENKGLNQIGAQTNLENTVSIHVLEKCGLTQQEISRNNGELWLKFLITKEVWKLNA